MLLQRAFIATLFAWAGGVLCYPFFIWATFKAHGMDLPLLGCLFTGFLLALFYVTAVVFPICLLVVTPLLMLLPHTSRLWRPSLAACIGALSGPAVMYIQWIASGGKGYASIQFKFPYGKAEIFTSIVVGAIFGYVVARKNTSKA